MWSAARWAAAPQLQLLPWAAHTGSGEKPVPVGSQDSPISTLGLSCSCTASPQLRLGGRRGAQHQLGSCRSQKRFSFSAPAPATPAHLPPSLLMAPRPAGRGTGGRVPAVLGAGEADMRRGSANTV